MPHGEETIDRESFLAFCVYTECVADSFFSLITSYYLHKLFQKELFIVVFFTIRLTFNKESLQALIAGSTEEKLLI